MSTAILGSGTFQDLFAPAKGKSEWGMDTLTRKVSGARSLLDAYIATLAQGQVYQGYYLQTWEPDDNPEVATVTLNYKGLLTGGTPVPTQETEITTVVGKTTADYSTEGIVEGVAQGRFYRKDLIWSVTAPSLPDQILGTSLKGFRDRYAVSAAMEFIYKAPQTVYRYISVGRPVAARYYSVGFSYTLVIEKARIILSDGTVYEGRDQEGYFGLTPIARSKVIGFQSKEVIGSPFWECQDVVRLELENA